MFDPPIFICCRDRVTPLRALVEWLEQAGHERIVLLDNDSTYPPLLEFYEQTPHQVIRLGMNVGKLALWIHGVPDEPFVYTDPDVVPIAECPLDAVQHLWRALSRHPHAKAGLGLYLEDVPVTLPSLEWERSLASPERELEPGVYDSLVDTTFALYRAGVPFELPALRTGYPYQARHLSWYARQPDAEDRYYLDRAIQGPEGSSWAQIAA